MNPYKMSSNLYPHEFPDFRDLIEATSKDKGILPQLVEKDYWIMHCLYGLNELGLSFELKGGTSLSKGYKIIKRFSEDIDLQIKPPPNMEVKCGRNHTKQKHVDTRRNFYDWLVNEKLRIPGIDNVKRDHDFDNQNLFSGGIRLYYRSNFSQLSGLKEGILLEVGFDITTPNHPKNISSWIYAKARESGIDFTDNLATNIRCYAPEYTFVEKLQTISTKFRKQQESKKFTQNFLRHYYDIYCLLDNLEVQEFIGTKEYERYKDKRFPQDDERCIAKNEAFLLSNPDARKLYESEYNKTHDLYYGGMVPFESVLEKIGQYIDRL